MTVASIQSERSRAFGDVVVDVEEAWAAVLTRSPEYGGRFIYAVATTGVYCRPGCPSRTPRRENVRYFATPQDAEAAGFRACRRCRPSSDGPSAGEVSIARARAYLDGHLDETVTLDRLSKVACLSAYHLQRTFKRQVGLTPRQYVEARRAERLKERLRNGDTVSRATFEAGYGSVSRMYEQSDAQLGMTPSTYREGGRGMRIRFATATTRLGRVLVAATARGVCAVELGEDDASLEAELRREYPRADLEAAGNELRSHLEAIVDYVGGASTDLTAVPLDVRATRFQWRVWSALRDIPCGETRSYGELAAAIGRPKAARAVARACATNRIAVVIPCHRAVRSDGGGSGYRWGTERKRRLLEMEAKEASSG